MLPRFFTHVALALPLSALVAQAKCGSELEWISTDSTLPKVV